LFPAYSLIFGERCGKEEIALFIAVEMRSEGERAVGDVT
jgi:hypothetical protein